MKNPNPRPTKKGPERKIHTKTEQTSIFWVKNDLGEYYCETSGSGDWTKEKAKAKSFKNASHLIPQLKGLEIKTSIIGKFFDDYEKEVWSSINS